MKIKAIMVSVSLSFLLIFFTAGGLLASSTDQVIETMGQGEVNWTKNVIRATGSGAPNPSAPNIAVARLGAERAAKVDALRNLLETVKGVRIDSETTVVNAMTQSDVIQSKVEGFVRGARVVNTKYLSDGGVEVVIEVPITGSFAEAVLPPMGGQPVPSTGSPVYTGLIIDTTGLDLRPAMSPKVVDEDGREVYGSAYVTKEFAIKQGIVGYMKDLGTARQNDRVTNNPIIVKGIKTEGRGNSNVVIKNSDANILRDTSKNLSFLSQCRVLFVVD
ncbi:MAG: LPP20 family lipoprotein [Desulfobacteria bacterium]